MTKQDNTNLNSAIAIKIGGRFPIQNEGKGNLYPTDRLLVFLNVNPLDEKAVIEYCNKYRFIPRDLSIDIVLAFKNEQQELKDIALRLLSEEATVEDLKKIDMVLKCNKR